MNESAGEFSNHEILMRFILDWSILAKISGVVRVSFEQISLWKIRYFFRQILVNVKQN